MSGQIYDLCHYGLGHGAVGRGFEAPSFSISYDNGSPHRTDAARCSMILLRWFVYSATLAVSAAVLPKIHRARKAWLRVCRVSRANRPANSTLRGSQILSH